MPATIKISIPNCDKYAIFKLIIVISSSCNLFHKLTCFINPLIHIPVMHVPTASRKLLLVVNFLRTFFIMDYLFTYFICTCILIGNKHNGTPLNFFIILTSIVTIEQYFVIIQQTFSS